MLVYSSASLENFIPLRGTRDTGMNKAKSPTILVETETGYRIDSGNTSEYQPRNSPSASRPRPEATKSVLFFFPSMYEIIVSIVP